MKALRLVPLGIILLAGAGRAEPPEVPPPIDQVVIRKGARVLELYAQGRPVHTISGIQLGAVPVGPKRFQGDKRTPEGRYTIDYGNPESSYFLSLHISYPDANDVAYAQAHGRSPGGQIFIHGQPNGAAARISGDWTDGCIAVSDDEMALLWETVPDGTVIDILP